VWRETARWTAAELAPQAAIWTVFFESALAASTYVAFVADDAGRAIGSGGVLVHLAIPRPGLVSERAGRVQSLYVDPERRRRGVARALMHHILAYARDAQLISLVLRPSDAGRALYSELGFRDADEMVLRYAPR
jgi:GNAT superfamily N-acetyltransferase